MGDLKMVFDLECKCGHILKIDTDKCNKYICPKCGEIVFEKFATLEDVLEHAKGDIKIKCVADKNEI